MRISIDRTKWEQEAQEGEIRWHLSNNWRTTTEFTKETEAIFTCAGLDKDAYSGKIILDAGCGPKLRTRYFLGAKIIAIDPLASKYIEIPWSDLRESYICYSSPLEETIDDLVGMCDLVISINVLDHCYDFMSCIKNLFLYMKPESTGFLSFDLHSGGMDNMHPIDLDEKASDSILTNTGFKIIEKRYARVYGGGDTAISYLVSRK